MTKREKLLKKLLATPVDMPYKEIKSLLESFDYTERKGKGSHRPFVKKGQQGITLSIASGKIRKKQLLTVIDILGLANEEESTKND